MINTNMRLYDYYILEKPDEYGQQKLAADAAPSGQIKMSISTTSQNIQDNILYNNAQYIGITHNNEIKDDYVIQYEEERLKVLYVAQGRFTAVYMARMV